MLYFAMGAVFGVLTCLLFFQIRKERVEKQSENSKESEVDNGREHLT